MRKSFAYCFLLIFFLSIGSHAFAACGDGECESGENSCSCPQDCGECAGSILGEKCKEYYCSEENVCKIRTILDCCPNKLCEEGEDYGDCPGDCEPTSLDLNVLSPLPGDSFLRGEPVLFRVGIEASGRKILAADVRLSGFLGSIELFNDGKHNDGNVFDGIYANTFFVEENTEAGIHELGLRAEFREVIEKAGFDLVVDPVLDVDLDVEDIHFLGDLIDVKGIVFKHGKRFSLQADLNISVGRRLLFSERVESDKNGFFSASYHSSLIDPVGEWVVSASGTDANNNIVSGRKEILLKHPDEKSGLKIELVNKLEEEYERQTPLELIATVKDIEGKLVQNASLVVLTALNESIELHELKPGEYSGTYLIPFDLPLQEQKFGIEATKVDESRGISLKGSLEFSFLVKKTSINVDVIEPGKIAYQIGEALPVKVYLSYTNNETVERASVKALINNKEIELLPVESGFFAADYLIEEDDAGVVSISINAVDQFENSGTVYKRATVGGYSLLYHLQKNFHLIAIALIALAFVFFAANRFLGNRFRLKSLRKRKEHLIALEKELQHKHFEKNTVSKQDYQALMDNYESELKNINGKMKRLEK